MDATRLQDLRKEKTTLVADERMTWVPNTMYVDPSLLFHLKLTENLQLEQILPNGIKSCMVSF